MFQVYINRSCERLTSQINRPDRTRSHKKFLWFSENFITIDCCGGVGRIEPKIKSFQFGTTEICAELLKATNFLESKEFLIAWNLSGFICYESYHGMKYKYSIWIQSVSLNSLIQPLVIQPTRLILPFSLDTLYWLLMLKSSLSFQTLPYSTEDLCIFLVELIGAVCIKIRIIFVNSKKINNLINLPSVSIMLIHYNIIHDGSTSCIHGNELQP